MLSFKQVDPEVLGPKYRKVKVEEPKVETPDESKEDLVKELVFDDETDSSTTLFSNGEPMITKEELESTYQIEDSTAKEDPEAIIESLTTQQVISMVLYKCPFCGGEAKVRTGIMHIHSSKEGKGTEHKTYAECYCSKCETHGPHFFDETHDGTFLFDAINAWNRRV